MRLAALYLLALAASAQFFPAPSKEETASRAAAGGAQEFDVRDWVDTGIEVKAGDMIRIAVSGTVRYTEGGEAGPAGTQKTWKDLLRTFPVNNAGRGALIGRIGDTPASRPFLIGESRESRAPIAGRLFLGINQPKGEQPDGSFRAVVEVAAPAEPRVPVDMSRLPKLTQQQLDSIPARVVDAQGTEGDRVNFIVIGPEQKLVSALLSAGWVKVNRTHRDAVIGALLSVLNRQGYVELPMSELMMFDRPQDYGFAMGDPMIVVAARHHFRVWKAPFTADGQQVWVGAGTHDVGFDKDQRNGNVTHKIDPDTDKERDFIGESLKATGEVAATSYMVRKNAVKRANTAHGQEFFSDGRTLIIVLNPDGSDQSISFSELFCTVLRDKNPDGGEWGECGQWIAEPAASAGKPLDAIPNQYRVLIVAGLMNTCFRGAPPYKEGQEYLRKTYGLTVEMLPLPNDSTEDNAKKIAEYLRAKMKEDPRKYIVLGYSKGAPDMHIALMQEKDVREATAAFVSIGGAIGGSPIADAIPDMAEQWIRQYNLPGCEGDLSAGFRSISTKVRKAFLASNPDLPVPGYSVAAISGPENTSKMLLQTKMILNATSPKNDSQLTEADQIIPGSRYLGTALADHFAVALPFETSQEAIRAQMDKNHFPRSALLEAVIRFVVQDLETNKP